MLHTFSHLQKWFQARSQFCGFWISIKNRVFEGTGSFALLLIVPFRHVMPKLRFLKTSGCVLPSRRVYWLPLYSYTYIWLWGHVSWFHGLCVRERVFWEGGRWPKCPCRFLNIIIKLQIRLVLYQHLPLWQRGFFPNKQINREPHTRHSKFRPDRGTWVTFNPCPGDRNRDKVLSCGLSWAPAPQLMVRPKFIVAKNLIVSYWAWAIMTMNLTANSGSILPARKRICENNFNYIW